MGVIAFMMFAAMALTAIVLLTGIAGFLRGGEFNAKYGNALMRARVGLQLTAVLLLGLLFLLQG